MLLNDFNTLRTSKALTNKSSYINANLVIWHNVMQRTVNLTE